LKSSAVITRASAASSAVAVAERGSPSIADISPSSSPGPRTPSRISRPSSVKNDTFTCPSVTITTRSELSPSLNSVEPFG
jgi:hypothetical protein